MPKKEVKKRGGSIRTRTVKVSKKKYMHCEIVPKAGPRGGHTICSKGKTRKGKK